MKLKYFAVAAALVSCVFTANAQQEEKLGNDIWLGVNGGVISTTTTTKMNKVQPYISIEVGKWFTPVWGGRIALAGISQYYGDEPKSMYLQNVDSWSSKQYFGELNVDGILNLSQAISKKSLPLCDFYLFLGPTMNLASKCTEFTGAATANGTYVVDDANGLKARFGITGGAGLSFNVSKTCALGIEYRTGVTPSIFGDASVCRKAENTNRFSIRFAYTFGGRLGKDGFAKKYGRVETVTNTVEVPVEKIVTKEVVKEVEKIVTKTSPAGSYVFFQIGKYNITDQDRVRLTEVAKAIKEGPKDVVYTISGNADKSTGSAKVNQKLSENRAKTVYDFLVKEGVNPDQLKTVANGGVDNMFFNQAALSRVSIIAE
ncbi:MAG: OmpA family protein [Bacteroidales bacterium]|nr:OmpA family protein [Bacteroidales bacterium]